MTANGGVSRGQTKTVGLRDSSTTTFNMATCGSRKHLLGEEGKAQGRDDDLEFRRTGLAAAGGRDERMIKLSTWRQEPRAVGKPIYELG